MRCDAIVAENGRYWSAGVGVECSHVKQRKELSVVGWVEARGTPATQPRSPGLEDEGEEGSETQKRRGFRLVMLLVFSQSDVLLFHCEDNVLTICFNSLKVFCFVRGLDAFQVPRHCPKQV